jgi:tRNA_anti-like
MKKKLLFSVLVLAICAAGVGYFMFNKKHFSVQNTVPAAAVEAIALHQTFVTDTTLAKNRFIGDENNQKVISVEGEVSEIKNNQQGNAIVLLKTATDGAFVNCTMEEKTTNINTGSKIVLKGICTGYNYDADMGIPGDVILTRCWQIKNK